MSSTSQGFVKRRPDYTVNLYHPKTKAKRNNAGGGWISQDEGQLKGTIRVTLNRDAIPMMTDGVVLTLWPNKYKDEPIAAPIPHEDDGRDEQRYEESRRSFEPDEDVTKTVLVEDLVVLTSAPEGDR